MKKHYGVIILSAVLAGAVFTGCGPEENLNSPVANNPVTEAAAEVTEAEIITEEETEAETEAVPEETEPAVTEAASKREANLAALEKAQDIEFGKSEDHTRLKTFGEMFEIGCANASDTVDGLAMAIYHLDTAAGTRYYDYAYTTDSGNSWTTSPNNSELVRIVNGTCQFIPTDNGDIAVFIDGGPIIEPHLYLIRQSADAPKPVISRNFMTFNEFAPEDGWGVQDDGFYDDEFKLSYAGGTELHIEYFRKDTGEMLTSFDTDFGDFDFTFE